MTGSAEAVLFGTALGDAMGYVVEFSTLSAIKARFGKNGIQEPPEPALYTDDTQMTLALARGLLAGGLDASLDTQMASVGAEFVRWMHDPENNRSPGVTTLRGLKRYQDGMDWRESGIIESKGCGAAMRVGALGFCYQHDEARLREMAVASSVITHRHEAGVASAVGAAYAVKLALDGVAVAEYIPRIMTFIAGMSEECDDALRRVGHVGAWTNEEEALEHIGRGWTGEEALALALYCVIRYPDDYTACMRRGANTEGDSDSIAAIAGGIMGARLGLDAIPADWRARCEHRDDIVALAARMETARAARASA